MNKQKLKTIVEKINLTLSPEKPYLIQLAKDHKWETPWVIDTSKEKPSQKDLEIYLNKDVFNSLQAETWIKDKDGLTTIFVLGFNKNYKITDPLKYLIWYINAIYSYINFQLFISYANKELIGKEEFFLTDKPDIARVSIVNHWFSQNPVTIWEKKNPQPIALQELDNKFSGREDLLITALNFQGLACVYDFQNISGYHAIKPQVGIKQGENYILDKQRILNFLQQVYGLIR